MVVGRQIDALQHRQINDFLHSLEHLIIGRAGLGQATVGQIKSSGRLIEAVVDHQLAPLLEEDVIAGLAGDAAGGEVFVHRFYTVGHLAALLAELDAAFGTERQAAAHPGSVHPDGDAPQAVAGIDRLDVILTGDAVEHADDDGVGADELLMSLMACSSTVALTATRTRSTGWPCSGVT